MRAELKGLHSPDVDDLKSFSPADQKNFSIFLQAFIGPVGSVGDDSFGIQVCTPAWLAQECLKSGVVLGRHMLIIEEYNFLEIEDFIKKYCSRVSGENWENIAEILDSLGSWEFDGYINL